VQQAVGDAGGRYRQPRRIGHVAGSTMSAWRAVAVYHGSWTMIVSGRRQARRNRFKS
jgi:hypothetical protein